MDKETYQKLVGSKSNKWRQIQDYAEYNNTYYFIDGIHVTFSSGFKVRKCTIHDNHLNEYASITNKMFNDLLKQLPKNGSQRAVFRSKVNISGVAKYKYEPTGLTVYDGH